MIHLGDALELVTPSCRIARRGGLREQTIQTEAQRQIFVGYLRDLAGGLILPGNHELRIDMETGLDFVGLVTDSTRGRFVALQEPGLITLRVGAVDYHGVLHHGEGPVVNPSALLDRLQRDTEGIDFIACGHIHQTVFHPTEVFSPSGTRTIQRFRVGHYLRRPTYAAVRPISTSGPTGAWHLTFDPRVRRIESAWLA